MTPDLDSGEAHSQQQQPYPADFGLIAFTCAIDLVVGGHLGAMRGRLGPQVSFRRFRHPATKATKRKYETKLRRGPFLRVRGALRLLL
jgi:hypothetical protein